MSPISVCTLFTPTHARKRTHARTHTLYTGALSYATEEALVTYAREELGCAGVTPVWLSCYVDGGGAGGGGGTSIIRPIHRT